MSLSPASVASAVLTTFTATATRGLEYSTFLALPTGVQKAPAQTRVILDPSHPSPTRVDTADPIVLFIIQTAVILGISRLLHVVLQRMRQPRVISEILGGILLGPTAFGRVPGFTKNIFPTDSLPFLNLVATLGLVLFLFLVGLEVDFTQFRKNAKVSASVSFVGLALPFALGCCVSVGLYKEFIDPETKFTHFMLFIGTSMSITAFPVLARILGELELLQDKVGVIVLAAGVANDVVGWILLALTVALVNASKGLVVLYILLCAIGWVLALWFVIRPVFGYMVRKSGSLEGHGPTQTVTCAALMITLTSAWVTDQIGVNAIFGGFLAGLIMPRSHGFAAHLTEKLEDLISVLFIPIFFAESGLKTNLGLLNSGIIWGWTICVMVTAFLAKFFGCATMAKWCGYSNRESAAVGSLMSCKGLIELIVLSIGLTAKVINQTVFSIFVLEALVLTFTSTPLTLLFYPQSVRKNADGFQHDQIDAETSRPSTGDPRRRVRTQITVVLERLDNLGAVMIFTKLIATPPNLVRSRTSPSSTLEKGGSFVEASPALAIDAVRLVELSDRTSAVMQASESEESVRSDPLSALYATFVSIQGIPLSSTTLAVVARPTFAANVAKKAREKRSDLIVVPWTLGRADSEGAFASILPNPFETFFDKAVGGKEGSPAYASFVRDVFAEASTDVALFLDRGTTAPPPSTLPGQHHIFLPFFGGVDDRSALELVLQLVQRNAGVAATIVHIRRAAEPTAEDGDQKIDFPRAHLGVSTPGVDETYQPTVGHGTHTRDTVYPGADSLQSESADTVAIELARVAISEDGLAVSLEPCSTAFPLQTCLSRLRKAADAAPDARLTTVVGRGRVGALSHRKELVALLANVGGASLGVARSSEVRRSLGEVGTAVLVGGSGSNLLILQSRLTAGVRKGD